jgi:hypothetical protein
VLLGTVLGMALLYLVPPLAALLFLGMTLDSARRHWRGRGSRWKGRDYGMPA